MSEPLALFILQPLAQFGELLHPDIAPSRLVRVGGTFALVEGSSRGAMDFTRTEDGRIRVAARLERGRVWLWRGFFEGAASLVVEEALLDAGNVVELLVQGAIRGKAVVVSGEVSATEREIFWERSIRDPLTKVLNRAWLQLRWPDYLLRASAGEQPVSLVYADLDQMKHLNDREGHLRGDTVLVSVAEVLRAEASARDGAELVRFGGEEFVILLPGAGRIAAREFAEKARRAIEEHEIAHRDDDGATRLRVTASFGIACSSDVPAGLDLQVLLREAEERCFDAKRTGRNRVAG